MIKKNLSTILSWLFLAVVVIYFAYSKGWIFAGFDSITPQQAQTLLKNDKNVFLLDVRTKEEFAQGYIEGATLIPVQELSENISQLQDEKDKTIIVYCHSGNRSVQASRILANNGFTPLNVSGGITGWKSESLPTIQ